MGQGGRRTTPFDFECPSFVIGLFQFETEWAVEERESDNSYPELFRFAIAVG
jgi:hypothetical protein